MPEMEARPPAENRHGGAPRGERPASWDAPRLTSADGRASQARQQNNCACRRSVRPSVGGERKEEDKPGRRNAPRERRELRCLTSREAGAAGGPSTNREFHARRRSKTAPRNLRQGCFPASPVGLAWPKLEQFAIATHLIGWRHL